MLAEEFGKGRGWGKMSSLCAWQAVASSLSRWASSPCCLSPWQATLPSCPVGKPRTASLDLNQGPFPLGKRDHVPHPAPGRGTTTF